MTFSSNALSYLLLFPLVSPTLLSSLTPPLHLMLYHTLFPFPHRISHSWYSLRLSLPFPTTLKLPAANSSLHALNSHSFSKPQLILISRLNFFVFLSKLLANISRYALTKWSAHVCCCLSHCFSSL